MPSSSEPLKEKEGHFTLTITGSPFELGYQHGSFLKEKVQKNIENHIKKPPSSPEKQKRVQQFLAKLPSVLPHIPKKYIEEMEGLAKGAEVDFSDILLLNLFPEMFHCCGITSHKEASLDSSLYHVRVLDYGDGKELHTTSVLIFVKPDGSLPFLNITYAGFIGSVTGMNEQKISIGEIGGLGYGDWDGMPMSFLLRTLLEEASSLQDAKDILSKTPKTCEYYYVIADGKTEESFGCYASSKSLEYISPGQNYSITPSPDGLHIFEPGKISQDPASINFKQPKNTILLTGFVAPERYPILEKRIEDSYGEITPKVLMDVIKRPVSRPSNLHNAIFHPSSLTVWFSHTEETDNLACDRPYTKFSWSDFQ